MNFLAIVQQRIAQVVQLREIDTQIGHFQHVLDVFGVWIFNVHIRWQHPENDFTIFRWLDARIPLITHHFGYIFRYARHARERFLTIVRKMPIHMPRFTEIIRSLDQHSGWPERGKHNDQMREMELGLQVELNGHVFLAILRLPPRLFASARQIFVDNLTNAMVTQWIVNGVFVRLAQEAFLFL